MPPLDGPRATLWVQRKPSKTRTEPSSILVGIETATHFLHSRRTFSMLPSMPSWAAVWRNWVRAISHGFSLRWDEGASTMVTTAPLLVGDAADGVGRRRRRPVACLHSLGSQADDVGSRPPALPVRPT